MKCKSPRRIYKNLERKYPDGLEVPCGQCVQCRINRREEWALRIMHEFLYWDSCIFLTLTYNDDSVPLINEDIARDDPLNQTIVKNDLVLFFKRLRKNINRKIKYYAVGEYGEKNFRPHYHALIFGIENNKQDKEIIKLSWQKCDWNDLGKSPFGSVTPQSIKYVTGYIDKVITGTLGSEIYGKAEKPFQIQSKGLGRQYAIDNKTMMIEDDILKVKGIVKSIPRYYKKINGLEPDTEKYQNLERELIESICGVFATRDELYHTSLTDDILKVERKLKCMRDQRDENIIAMIKQKKRIKN